MAMISRPIDQTAGRFPAVCSSLDVEGDLVQITGEATPGVYQVQKVDVGAGIAMPASAIIVEKTSATECMIQFPGQIKNVFTGLTPGAPYFAAANGKPSLAPPGPTLSQPRVYVQPVGVALTPTVLLFNPSFSLVVRVL